MSWVSTAEAAKILGVNKTSIMNHARRMGMETQNRRGTGGFVTYFREEDLCKLDIRCGYNSHLGRATEIRTAIGLTEWADSLKKWPSDDEIHRRTTEVYRYRDVVGVLETRIYRGRAALKRPRVDTLTLADARCIMDTA